MGGACAPSKARQSPIGPDMSRFCDASKLFCRWHLRVLLLGVLALGYHGIEAARLSLLCPLSDVVGTLDGSANRRC
jgi:hypothetical protein